MRRMVLWAWSLALLAGPASLVVGREPAPEAAPGATEAPYEAAGRRDPFRPPRMAAALAGVVSPLQQQELGQLRLVGVIYGSPRARAVLEDDAGLGYIVTVGTPIGPNGGTVHAIERGRVVVREANQDYYGEMQVSEVVLELDEADERGKQ